MFRRGDGAVAGPKLFDEGQDLLAELVRARVARRFLGRSAGRPPPENAACAS